MDPPLLKARVGLADMGHCNLVFDTPQQRVFFIKFALVASVDCGSALGKCASVLLLIGALAMSALSLVADAQKVVRVAAGGFHNLELREDGTVWAWGSNLEGQLGEN